MSPGGYETDVPCSSNFDISIHPSLTQTRESVSTIIVLLIANEWRGKGLGRQALERLTAYARDHIGLRQLYVFIALDNEVCLKLFEDFGYSRSGILKLWVKRGNTYRDVALLQMIF